MANQHEIERLADRVARLEENQGFSERAAQGVSAEVYALTRRLDELAQRLDRLTNAVRSVIQTPEDEGASPGGQE